LVFIFTSWKKQAIEIIDEQLDQIEHQIISLQKDDREKETAYIKNFLNDNEKLIQNRGFSISTRIIDAAVPIIKTFHSYKCDSRENQL
jgi:hypothetical protein